MLYYFCTYKELFLHIAKIVLSNFLYDKEKINEYEELYEKIKSSNESYFKSEKFFGSAFLSLLIIYFILFLIHSEIL